MDNTINQANLDGSNPVVIVSNVNKPSKSIAAAGIYN